MAPPTRSTLRILGWITASQLPSPYKRWITSALSNTDIKNTRWHEGSKFIEEQRTHNLVFWSVIDADSRLLFRLFRRVQQTLFRQVSQFIVSAANFIDTFYPWVKHTIHHTSLVHVLLELLLLPLVIRVRSEIVQCWLRQRCWDTIQYQDFSF